MLNRNHFNKFIAASETKSEIRNELIWNFLSFDHLRLFRISDFEFRICSFVYTWRSLRFGGMFCAFLRVIVFRFLTPKFNREFQTSWLGIRRGLAGKELAHPGILAVIAQFLRMTHGHDALHLFI
jgi:hypothetical protein